MHLGIDRRCPARSTPVYMAPELIHSRDGGHGYDGKQVDVWASGILLIVMLLGTFPYDHIVHPDPNSVEAHEEVWCAPWHHRAICVCSSWCVACDLPTKCTYFPDHAKLSSVHSW